MTSRDMILKKLRMAERPFSNVEQPAVYRTMVPPNEMGLLDWFVQEAEKAACVVYRAVDREGSVEQILALIGGDKAISCWDLEHIPLPELGTALDRAGAARKGQNADVRVGITGVDAALAATGSLVFFSGMGKYRAASLLPPIHIAVMREAQIYADLEGWVAALRERGLDDVRKLSNVVLVTGPSRTADIAMTMVMGMHGPRELHIVIVP